MKTNNQTIDALDDLQITLKKAKAVAEAFSILYVDPARADDRALEITSSPDRHCYLYSVLEDLIADSDRLAASIRL